MDKIWVIIQREYLTRLKSKSFILTTFLSPLVFGLFIFIPILSSTFVEEESYDVFVQDPTGRIYPNLRSDEVFTFLPVAESEADTLKDHLQGGQAFFAVPPSLYRQQMQFTIYSHDNLSLQVVNGMAGRIREAVNEYKKDSAGIGEQETEILDFQVSVSNIQLKEGGEQEMNQEIATLMGYAMSFAIYILVIMYGAAVMKGVVEEKSNRIVEVVISTVRPFQLMMGKILGIGFLGLTQMIIWVILIMLIAMAGIFFFAGSIADPGAMQQMDPAQAQQQAEMIRTAFDAFDFTMIIWFLFYFLFGYLLYASLFAAVGSAADQETEANQYTFIVMFPLILPMLVIANILQNPNGTLAVVGSIIPLLSPTIMMIRLAGTDVPAWELALSALLLIAGFAGAVWVAGRIYRVGILMYGKKIGLKEILRWIWR